MTPRAITAMINAASTSAANHTAPADLWPLTVSAAAAAATPTAITISVLGPLQPKPDVQTATTSVPAMSSPVTLSVQLSSGAAMMNRNVAG